MPALPELHQALPSLYAGAANPAAVARAPGLLALAPATAAAPNSARLRLVPCAGLPLRLDGTPAQAVAAWGRTLIRVAHPLHGPISPGQRCYRTAAAALASRGQPTAQGNV